MEKNFKYGAIQYLDKRLDPDFKLIFIFRYDSNEKAKEIDKKLDD